MEKPFHFLLISISIERENPKCGDEDEANTRGATESQ